VQYTHFADFKKLFDYSHPNFFNFITLLFYFSFPNFPPEIFQRVLIAKNIKQVQKSFYLAFVICLSIISATIFMAILLFYINPNLEPNKIFHFIVENYLYSGIKGLAIVGLIAMIMSTADSNINSSAILLTDFFRSFKMTSPEFELIIARAFSVILGVIAIILALSKTDLLSIILSTASFYMPIVNIPLMLAILGFRSTKKAVLIGMGAGFITVISSYFIDISIDIIIPAMAINLIFFMGSHYLLKQEGGWVGIKDKSPLEEIQRDRKKKIDSILKSIQEFNLIKFCKSNSPKDDTTYSFFGIFCFVSTIATIYSTNNYSMNQHYDILLYIYESMLVISTCFMFYTIWSSRIKIDYVVGIAWNVSLIYMLTFCSTFFVLLSNFGKLQLIVFTLNLVVMFIITRWQVALTMIFLGLICSMQWYKYYMGIESLSIALGSGYFNLLYALLLVSTALITFLKPKQEYLEATEVKVGTLETEVSHLGHEVIDLNEQVTHYSEQVADKDKEIERLGATAQKILNNVNHELRLPIGNVVNFSEMLSETLGKSDNKLVKELSKEVYDNSNRASTMILNMLDLATLDVKKVDLQKTMINFSELVTDRVKTCRKIYLRDKKIDFELTIEPEVMIAVDPNYIRQTVDNLVINAINFSREGLIKVAVSKQPGQVMFTIIDQGKGIPTEELSDIFTPFKMGSNSESKAQGRGVGLALCKSAVEAHGGSITANSNGKIGATFRFILPI
jgi:signal transduction histidine kinase